MEIMSLKPTGGHCYNLPRQLAAEQIVTHGIFPKVIDLGNIQSMGSACKAQGFETSVVKSRIRINNVWRDAK